MSAAVGRASTRPGGEHLSVHPISATVPTVPTRAAQSSRWCSHQAACQSVCLHRAGHPSILRHLSSLSVSKCLSSFFICSFALELTFSCFLFQVFMQKAAGKGKAIKLTTTSLSLSLSLPGFLSRVQNHRQKSNRMHHSRCRRGSNPFQGSHRYGRCTARLTNLINLRATTVVPSHVKGTPTFFSKLEVIFHHEHY